LSALFEGNAGSYKLSGYAEMDFLGTGTSSNNNQSDSYVLRQRQIWGQAATAGGFTVTGGQMWSLTTEDRRSADPRSEIQPQTIDPQYLVGYTWTRQPEIRLEQRFGDVKTGAFTIAMSVEQSQITNFTVSSGGASAAIPLDFFFAGVGQNGGLYNAAASAAAGNASPSAAITTYANNVAPDVIVKGVIDVPNFHAELGGIARFLRDYYYPILTSGGTTAAPTYTYAGQEISNTKAAGGIFGSARVYLGKFAEVSAQVMAGTGTGRYGSSQLADATLRPDETLEPIKNYHGLSGIEMHLTPKLDAYVYYGGEYAQRTVYTTAQGVQIGYAPIGLNNAGCYNNPTVTGLSNGSAGSISAGTCSGSTRYIQEAMGGLTYKVVNSPKYGRLQYQLTYSYIQRNLWAGQDTETASASNGVDPNGATTPSGPRATEPMVHVSMRYYIP
jgi:hypothetical protein